MVIPTRAMRLALGLVILTAFAPRADAQLLKWEDHAYVTFSLGDQPQSRTFAESSGGVIYEENASSSVPHTISSRSFVDFSAGMRVWSNIGVGIGLSQFSDKDSSTITAQIPNPLIFSAPRTATASTGDLQHRESDFRLQLIWVLPVSNKIELMVFGGPSFLAVKQDFVTVDLADIVENAPPPFNTVALGKAKVTTSLEHVTGFNFGVDGTFRVTKMWGAGAFIRFSGASVDFSLPAGGTVNLDAGGFQMGGGPRFRF